VCKIRKAEIKDIEEIKNIYNKAIVETVATFDTVEKSSEDMKKWFEAHGSKYPIVVSEIDDEIVGWAALSSYSTRCAYSDTTELSLYIKEDFQGQGIGNKLMTSVLEEGKKAGIRAILARITDGNEISIKLHEKHGFFHVGVLKKVGKKFGKILDVYLMEKVYE
jgi:phosphinothricin acetyltransferase